MDEVEVVRRAVLGRIHRHRRDDDAVGELQPAQPERREHRRRGLVDRAAPRLRLEPALDAFQPVPVAQPQIFVADALRAGEQRISELDRLEMEIAVERLEPFGRVAGAVLELEHLEVALGLIFGERRVAGQAGPVQHLGELDRSPRARAWCPSRSRNGRCGRRRRAGSDCRAPRVPQTIRRKLSHACGPGRWPALDISAWPSRYLAKIRSQSAIASGWSIASRPSPAQVSGSISTMKVERSSSKR